MTTRYPCKMLACAVSPQKHACNNEEACKKYFKI